MGLLLMNKTTSRVEELHTKSSCNDLASTLIKSNIPCYSYLRWIEDFSRSQRHYVRWGNSGASTIWTRKHSAQLLTLPLVLPSCHFWFKKWTFPTLLNAFARNSFYESSKIRCSFENSSEKWRAVNMNCKFSEKQRIFGLPPWKTWF